jgi:hypothetical protein
MKRSTTIKLVAALLAVTLWQTISFAKGDDFNSVVKMIEDFYNVKHEGIPFLAKAAMKAVGVGAKIKGGDARRFAEAGSVKLATFENQEFKGDFIKFRQMLNDSLTQTWSPLVQTLAAPDREQSYIFVRENGDKFRVLIVVIEQQEATVVQATVSPKNLALLMKDPEEGAKAITQEATIVDHE